MKKIIGLIILLIVVLYFFDFSFLKGEITEYPLSCDRENFINYQCTIKWLPLNSTTYKPNANKQQVIYSMNGFDEIRTLKKCSVINRKNWTCTYDDESGEFGFKNGQYWDVSLKPSVSDGLFEFIYVSKLFYRIEELKWW